jgi:hypothetical protein
MNSISANYAIAKGPSFTAQLKFQNNKDKSFNDKQIALMQEQVKKIGTDTDTVDIKVGDVFTTQDGTPFDDLPDYKVCKIDVQSTLGDKTVTKAIKGHAENPYEGRLKDYLDKVQDMASVPSENIPEQIKALEAEELKSQGNINQLSWKKFATYGAYEAAVLAEAAAYGPKKDELGQDVARKSLAYRKAVEKYEASENSQNDALREVSRLRRRLEAYNKFIEG